MKSLILTVWGWCPHLSCYVSELFEIPSTSCGSNKSNCFSQVSNPFCRFQAPPLLNGFKSLHMQPSLQHTHTFLLSVFLYFHTSSHLIWKYSSLSVCVLFIFPSSCFWNPFIPFFAHIFCSPSCMFLSVIFFFQLYFTIKFPFLFSHLYP